jgi:beta-glucosidase-like glycosyl hydrolase/CubicO group peptidase (beta-lactamase class C family)
MRLVKNFFLFFLTAIVLFGCAPQQVGVKKEIPPPPPIEESIETALTTPHSWVEEQLESMTLEEKVAQMIVVRAYGYYFSDDSEQFQKLVRAVRDKKYGGVCVFQGDVLSTAVLLNRLQAMAKVPLLVSSDFEWGAAMRMRRSTRFPEAMAIGAANDTGLAFAMGKIIAEEARAIGIHQVFAPVADVNLNPNNPVINTRSFGESPTAVAVLCDAMSRGMQTSGVIASAKHFPGHGDTDIDSHLKLPIIKHPRSRLDSVEFVPFRRLINGGIGAVMIAHVKMPAIDKIRPATISKLVTTDLLRNELGFEGLIVTDALEMDALVDNFPIDSVAVLAVEAGNDMLLLPEDDEITVEAILHAVRSGRISEERINQSVKKILACKEWLGLADNRFVEVERIGSLVAIPDHRMKAKELARSSITVLKNDNMLPLQMYGQSILNIIVSDVEDYRTEIHRETTPNANERVGNYFTSQLRSRSHSVTTPRIDPSTATAALHTIEEQAKKAELVLIAVYSKARSGAGRFGLPQSVINSVNKVMSVQKPKVVVAFGSPYVLQSFPNAQAYLCAYSDAEPSVEATVEALFGEIPTKGKLPVTIPGMFAYGSGLNLQQTTLLTDRPEFVGFDAEKLSMVDSLMLKAIDDSVFPGGQVVVVKNGVMVFNKSFGRMEYADTSKKVTEATMYDLASLTKVLATTAAVMKLYEERKLTLDDAVIKYIPEFGVKGKEKITIRNLLLHNSGLPAFKSLLNCKSADEVLDSVFSSRLVYRTGDSTVYSDIGFITLGKIVERITGATLDAYVDTTFFKPLRMMRTMFNPSESLWTTIAPTEYDSLWRKNLVRGTVHDERAAMLNGVSGHAGLFSTASDLAVFMQMLLNGGMYDGRRFLQEKTIELFTKRQSKSSTRALGWDTKTVNGYSSAGTLFSEKSFGHTGFTGTSIWADPEKKIFVIVLTNRVYPTRNNNKIIRVRPIIHDTVIKALNLF